VNETLIFQYSLADHPTRKGPVSWLGGSNC